jgi:tetratricopeptide (TPR) repeat protein
LVSQAAPAIFDILMSFNCLAASAEPVDFEVVEKNYGKDYVKGTIAAEHGKNEEAVQWFSKSIVERPEEKSSYMQRADAYIKLKKYREALADVDKYAALLDRSSQREDKSYLWGIDMTRGEALEGLGRNDEAVKYYKHSLENRDSVEGHMALGEIYKKHGQKAQALQEFQAAKEIMGLHKGWSTIGWGDTEKHVDEMLVELQPPLKSGKQPAKKK